MRRGDSGQQQWVLVCCILLFSLQYAATQTQVCAYYENQTIYSYQPYTQLQVTVSLNSGAVSGSGASTTINQNSISYVQFESMLTTPSAPTIIVQRTLEMVDASATPPRVRLTTFLSHEASSASVSLNNIQFSENIGGGLQAYWTSSFVPGFTASGVSITGRTDVLYAPSAALLPGNNERVQFEAEPSGENGEDLPAGIATFYSYLSFNDTSTLNSFGPLSLPVCLKTVREYNSSVFYQHGFTALTFFVALLVGFLLVVLVVFLYIRVYRRRKKATVSPSQHDERRMKETGKKIVMDPKAALRKGLNVIKDYSIMAWNESVVLILSLKDKLHMFREIDNLDVLATIHVDTDLEQEQNDAAIQTCLLLVNSLRHNGDISTQTEDAAVSKFNSQLKELEKKQDAEYRKELEVVYTDLSAKNKERLAELLQKQRQQKQQAVAVTKEMPDKERQKVMKLIGEQHQMEENELTFTLALEQNEAAEKLRKEYAIHKRMGIKELQQSLMSEVIGQGKLRAEQADWLLKEHKKQQEAVHRMYDEEISRQRMVLEEKLARRRALAQASETQEDDNTERLNMSVSHALDFYNKGKKSDMITAEQTEEWIEELKAKALFIKTDMETAKETQEKELHKKLSQAKVTQLDQMMKTQEAEVKEYITKSKSQQLDGPVDPIQYVEGLLKLKSQHRVELANLENQLDTDHAQQLTALREQLSESVQDKLKDVQTETVRRMEAEGMGYKAVESLLKKHEAEMESLRSKQEKNRRNEENKLKEELARRRREWADRRERERREQEDLREHEAEVVEKLVGSQLSMSEAERDRIMREHEKQMVLLENSLTLNKLRQQRSLEERLNQKRAQQMKRLQEQQQKEVVKRRKAAENSGEDEDEAAQELMTKHVQQRIAIIQGSQLNVDEELAQIHIEMTKERALALKTQEERLGAMITSLQLEKARQMTQIQEQQKAIHNLKASLMDDLSERGILSTPECERILDIHKQESEALNERLEAQRAKQEKLLTSKLQARLQQREQVIMARHEAEMKNLMTAMGNKFAAKVRRVMLIHKHMVEMEKFRNRLDREISQALADIRTQFEMSKLRKLQEQELTFVAGLVRVGELQQEELLDALHLLFPSKTEEDIQQLLAILMQDSVQNSSPPDPRQRVRRNSTVVEKIYLSQYAQQSPLSRSGSKRGSSKRKKLPKQSSNLSLTRLSLAGLASVDEERNPSTMPDFRADRRDRRSSTTQNTFNNRAYDDYQDDYGGRYDSGMDFIGMGTSMLHGEGDSPAVGRLRPLQEEQEGGRKKKKKKKGLLKLHKEV